MLTQHNFSFILSLKEGLRVASVNTGINGVKVNPGQELDGTQE